VSRFDTFRRDGQRCKGIATEKSYRVGPTPGPRPCRRFAVKGEEYCPQHRPRRVGVKK
jgi:hypothetical protein